MKSIFIASVAYDAGLREEELAYQLMRICRQLESAELQILKAASRLFKEKPLGN